MSFIGEPVEPRLFAAEKSRLVRADHVFHDSQHRRLVTELESGAENSDFSECPSGTDALHELLVRLRLKQVHS